MLTQVYNDMSLAKFDGLSTDNKPVDCPNGSEFNEIDTGDKYLFDADSEQWYKVPTGGGGGGGGTSDYDDLQSKPSINGSVLRGNKTSAHLGLQPAISSDEKLDSGLIDDTNSVNKFVTQEEKAAWNGKQEEISDLAAIRSGASAGATAVQPEAFQSAIGSLDASKANNADLEQEATSRQNADIKLDAALEELVNSGAKNKIEMTSTNTTITRYGVTATYDKVAGTITLTGAHSESDPGSVFEFYSGNATDQRELPPGTYHLSGCPSGGSTNTFRAVLNQIEGAVDTGSGANFTLASPKYAAYRILVSGNCDFTGGYVFKPMVCAKSVWDISDTFVPYRPTNADISDKQDKLSSSQLDAVNSGIDITKVAAIASNTEAIAGKQDGLTTAQLAAVNSGATAEKITNIETNTARIAKQLNSGAKNLLKITQINLTQTKNGVTATFDPIEGTVTLNGDYDGGSGTIFDFYTGSATDQEKIPAGTYYMSGCPSGGSTSSYRVSLNGITAVDAGNGVEFTISEPKPLAPRILVSGNQRTFSNMVFKMMVCKKDDYDTSNVFAPYCPTDYAMYKSIMRPLSGKKISFYGDSITTFSGWIPTGNKAFYTGSNCNVSHVYQTWWMRTVQGTGAELCVDQAWSGRTVSNVRDSETDLVNSGAWRQSEVDKLAVSGSTPDIIIIKLGINDFNNVSCQIGTYDGTEALPTVPDGGFATFRESYATMLNRIMTTYPLARVYCCTLNTCERSGSVGFPEINGLGESLTEYNDAIKQLAGAFGAGVIDHAACGMTYYNMSAYTGDWDSTTGKGLHPNYEGMRLIAEKTISALISDTVRK